MKDDKSLKGSDPEAFLVRLVIPVFITAMVTVQIVSLLTFIGFVSVR